MSKMKCADVIEFGHYCSIKDALEPCDFRDKKTNDCLKHKQAFDELNKQYGCYKVFVKKSECQK